MNYEEPTETIIVARAYVYGGEWVADCPREGCGNVEFLYTLSRMNGPRDQRRDFYLCSYCGMQAKIAWPRREQEIIQVLSLRPIPGTRNWYPHDHPVAVNFRIPHGQSISQLLDENEEHGVDNAPLRGLR
jgi:hypothetical protein